LNPLPPKKTAKTLKSVPLSLSSFYYPVSPSSCDKEEEESEMETPHN
jgi:hypothetical protein